MNRLDIKVGFACNNRCVFCVQGDKRLHEPPLDLETLLGRMKQGRPRNTGIVLTGGEVTIRPDFLTLVKAAKALGYTHIQIQSNGRMFHSQDFCRKTIAAGANEFALALHGSTAELHNTLTRSESFNQTLQGIHNLRQMGQTVITNTVVTQGNLHDLGNIVRLLHRQGVKQAQLAMVHPLGTAADLFDEVVPRLDEAAPLVVRAVRAMRAHDMDVHTEAMPLCLLDDLAHTAAEAWMPSTEIMDASVHLPDYAAYRKTEGKLKGPQCAACDWDDRCEGPWREYVERHGAGALRPVKVASA